MEGKRVKHTEKSGKVSSGIGIARKSKTKKRRKWRNGNWRTEKLEEILERRRREGTACIKILKLVVHERMSQGDEVRGAQVKNKVKGWSTEEMKDKTRSQLEDDTGEMMNWRSMSQENMDQCWKKLAEKNGGRGFGQVQGRGQQKRGLPRQPFWNGGACEKQEVQNTKVERRLLGKNLRSVQRIQPAASAKHA